MGKRKNGFWEISLQISPKNAMEMFYTYWNPIWLEKKVKKIDPLGAFLPPPRENRQKNSKNGLKWPFLPIKWCLRHTIHCKNTLFWCAKPNLMIFSEKFRQK